MPCTFSRLYILPSISTCGNLFLTLPAPSRFRHRIATAARRASLSFFNGLSWNTIKIKIKREACILNTRQQYVCRRITWDSPSWHRFVFYGPNTTAVLSFLPLRPVDDGKTLGERTKDGIVTGLVNIGATRKIFFVFSGRIGILREPQIQLDLSLPTNMIH